jgi:hypothetical protein
VVVWFLDVNRRRAAASCQKDHLRDVAGKLRLAHLSEAKDPLLPFAWFGNSIGEDE